MTKREQLYTIESSVHKRKYQAKFQVYLLSDDDATEYIIHNVSRCTDARYRIVDANGKVLARHEVPIGWKRNQLKF